MTREDLIEKLADMIGEADDNEKLTDLARRVADWLRDMIPAPARHVTARSLTAQEGRLIVDGPQLTQALIHEIFANMRDDVPYVAQRLTVFLKEARIMNGARVISQRPHPDVNVSGFYYA